MHGVRTRCDICQVRQEGICAALDDEARDLLGALSISDPADPLGPWMRARLAHVERELEAARADRRLWQAKLFGVLVQGAETAGDPGLLAFWKELVVEV